MRIAMVVHNDVRRDARVMKEATSLSAAGHDVIVYGLTTDPEAADFSFGPRETKAILSYRSDVGMDHSLLRKLPLENERSSDETSRELLDYLNLRISTRTEKICQVFSHQGAILADAVIRSAKPDVVHIHDHVALTAAPIFKHFLDVPLVWDAHEIYQELAGSDPERAQANAAVIAQNSVYVDRFVTINDSIASYYAEQYPNLTNAIVLPNAAMKVGRPAYDGRLHEAAGLTKNQKILLFQGGMGLHRGVPQLVAAAKHFPVDWSLVFMGWGPLKDQMQQIVAKYPTASEDNPRVAFIDGAPQDELPFWTAGASLGAIPYENTGLNHLYCTPNKLWEYPLAGVPILASDLQEMGRVLRQFGIGKLIPRDFNEEDILLAISELSEQELEEMCNNCRIYAGEQNWQANEHRLLRLYDELSELIEGGRAKWNVHSQAVLAWPNSDECSLNPTKQGKAGHGALVSEHEPASDQNPDVPGNFIVAGYKGFRHFLLAKRRKRYAKIIKKSVKLGILPSPNEVTKERARHAEKLDAMADQMVMLKQKLEIARVNYSKSLSDLRVADTSDDTPV